MKTCLCNGLNPICFKCNGSGYIEETHKQINENTLNKSNTTTKKEKYTPNSCNEIDYIKNNDILTLLAYGKKERDSIVQYLITKYWVSGMLAPLAKNLGRVFGKIIETRASSIGLSLVTGKITSQKNSNSLSNRSAWGLIFNELNDTHAGNPFKGEKLLYLNCINQAILFSHVRKEQDTLKMDATSDSPHHFIASTTSEIIPAQTFPEVLTWLAEQKKISISKFRLILLPLDLLPSAIIDELNERALDLTGELALEEVDDDIIVIRETLDAVISNLKTNKFER